MTIRTPRRLASLAGTAALALAFPLVASGSSGGSGGTPSWPTYQFDNTRSGDNVAPQPRFGSSRTHLGWTAHAGGPISAQPVLANNLVYWGAWDGFERASTLSGQPVWSTFVGQTVTPSDCYPVPLGVGSTPTVATVGGRSILYVGGGDATMYALDALNGAVIWTTNLSNAPSGVYLWSSPAVSGGMVYEGVGSAGDCPLTPGAMVQLSAQGLVVQHVFPLVPPGCNGAGVWGSPTVDEAAGMVYFGTSNSDCFPTPYANAYMALRTSDLSLASFWPVPAGPAEDTGSTPTLFTASIGGAVRKMMGMSDKNGFFYAFDRSLPLSNGPLWSSRIDVGGDDPESGEGPISPAAWDGSSLYVAGGNTTVAGSACSGSVRALDPATGSFRWEHCLADPVLGAVSLAQGVAVVGAGRTVTVVSTSTGATRFTFTDTSSGFFFQFWGAASVAGSTAYYGNMDGTLFTFPSS